ENAVVPPAEAEIVTLAPAGSRRRGFAGWRMPGALAASLALLILGGFSGYFLAGFQGERAEALVRESRLAERNAIGTAVSEAREKRLSGAPLEWQSSGARAHGAVPPTRTFRSATGEWCREYEEMVQYDDGTVEHRRGIACRTGDGEWKTRLHSGENS